MPKMKTHQATKKRIKKTGTGKLKREKSHQNHFLSKKRGSRKRSYKKMHDVHDHFKDHVKRALGDK